VQRVEEVVAEVLAGVILLRCGGGGATHGGDHGGAMVSGGGRRRAPRRKKANAWPRREPMGAWHLRECEHGAAPTCGGHVVPVFRGRSATAELQVSELETEMVIQLTSTDKRTLRLHNSPTSENQEKS
jgi:hypothetical protein